MLDLRAVMPAAGGNAKETAWADFLAVMPTTDLAASWPITSARRTAASHTGAAVVRTPCSTAASSANR
jgi:hypothetical protein